MIRPRSLAHVTDEDLRGIPASQLARREGVSARVVFRERKRRGISAEHRSGSWYVTPGLREMSDAELVSSSLSELAVKLGCSPPTASDERRRRGLSGSRAGGRPPSGGSRAWLIPLGCLYGVAIVDLARRYRCTYQSVQRVRAARLRSEIGPRGR